MTRPLSLQVFDVLTFMDCHPPVSLAGAVNATASGSGRKVYEALAGHLQLPFEDSPTGAADAVNAWEDRASGFEIRAALTACGRAEKRRERDEEEDADLQRHMAEADAWSAERVAFELRELELRPVHSPTRWDYAYRLHLEKLHRRHQGLPAEPMRECCAEAAGRTSHWHCPKCGEVVSMYGHECDPPVPVDLADDALPQDTYIAAVAAALNAAGIDVADRWTSDGESKGIHPYLDAVITLAPIDGQGDDDGWPDGLLLLWEWHTGLEDGGPERGPVWRWAELHADGSNEHPDELMVAGYASPDAVVTAARKAIAHELGAELIGGSWEYAGVLNAACEAWGAGEEPAPSRTVTINWIPGSALAQPTYVVAYTVNGESTGSEYVRPDQIDDKRAGLVEDGWTITVDERPGGDDRG
jgi:hypothetical protein